MTPPPHMVKLPPKSDTDYGHLSQSEKDEAKALYEREKRRTFAKQVAEELRDMLPACSGKHECRLSDEAILFFSTPDTIYMLKGMAKAYKDSEETRKYLNLTVIGLGVTGILGFIGTCILLGFKAWVHAPPLK